MMMEYQQERIWLFKKYRPTPSDGPAAKRVKVSSIKSALESQFSRKYEHKILSSLIQETFPNTEKRRLSQDRATHVVGLEEVQAEVSTPTMAMDVDEEKEELKARIRELEQTVRDLRVQVAQLEEQLQATSTSTSSLMTQVDHLLLHNMAMYHGPNTIHHFSEFSLDSIRAEIKETAPALFQLFTTLSLTAPTGDDDQSRDDTKAITSLSVLLRNRSAKALGLQLLIGMMLVARATNCRVSDLYIQYHVTHIYTND